MAELATIARPYADALFKAAGEHQGPQLAAQMDQLAQLAGSDELRRFADHPRTAAVQVFDLIAGVALSRGLALDVKVGNLLRTVLDNGRLAALPEIASQFQTLVNGRSGVSEAVIESAFPIDEQQLAGVLSTLETRFKRKLRAQAVRVVPDLIGGIRATVGDEVLDTSVRARLDQMKAALTA